MALFSTRTWSEWVGEYSLSHQHPVNRWCHTFGIPMVSLSVALAVGALLWPGLWLYAAGLFVLGWIVQFIGHAVEGKRPEFFKDLRFMLVGVRWWLEKAQGRV
jgi:uncharacterized membrane protein YGL010W